MIPAPKIHSAPDFRRPCSVWGGPGLRFSGTRPIPGQGRGIDGHPGVGLVASQKAGRPYKEPQKYPQKVPPKTPPRLAGSPQKIWDVLGDLLDFSLPASPGVPPSTPLLVAPLAPRASPSLQRRSLPFLPGKQQRWIAVLLPSLPSLSLARHPRGRGCGAATGRGCEAATVS